MKRLLSSVLLLLTCAIGSTALAQSNGGDACGVLACGAGGIIYLLIIAVCCAIPIVIIVVCIKFIGKDARARGMANADSIKWLGLLGVLGLVIYLLQRPDVVLVTCPGCGKPRATGQPCPHCGNA